MIHLYDLDFAALRALLTGWGQPAFRAKQLWEWLYVHKVESFDAMHTLPAALRERLAAETTLHRLTVARALDSTDGFTRKWLFQLPDGQLIESVLMGYDDGRRTACISSQAGCAMGCVFCATGQMGFARHLTAGEIVEQAVFIARELSCQNERLSNVVLMGMGEPLHNYAPSLAAVRRLNDEHGLNIGQRHITVSTVGLVPQIRQFAEEGLQVKLAVSLHAATDDARSALLPVNKRWPLAELMAAAREYVDKTGRRITFEWALIYGETDTPGQAHDLGKLLQGLLCHVNVIPLNPTAGYGGRPSDPARVAAFQAILSEYGVSSSVRVRRGIDINAGCGQLKAAVLAS